MWWSPHVAQSRKTVADSLPQMLCQALSINQSNIYRRPALCESQAGYQSALGHQLVGDEDGGGGV